MSAVTSPAVTLQTAPAAPRRAALRLQWIAVFIIMLGASLNYLDRQLLAAFAPSIKTEFGMNNTQYGQLIGAFALTYALVAPLMGFFIDYAGLRWGVTCTVACWSLFSTLTGFAGSLRSVVTARIGLALGESGLGPTTSKAGALYLDPAELAVSSGFGAGAIALGVAAAPMLAALVGPRFGWRGTFRFTGLLGLVWIALWLFASRRIAPRAEAVQTRRLPYRELLLDRRLWGASIAWALALLNFALWSSWMTIFLVQRYGLREIQANRRYAWLPPLFSILGGFAGGSWVFRSIRRGNDPLQSRLTNTSWMALLLPATALAPWMPTPGLAVALIGVSYLGSFAISGNTNVMPIDIFGSHHAGVAGSVAAAVYGLLQALCGPLMGMTIDHLGFKAGFAGVGLLSMTGVLILRWTMRAQTPDSRRTAA